MRRSRGGDQALYLSFDIGCLVLALLGNLVAQALAQRRASGLRTRLRFPVVQVDCELVGQSVLGQIFGDEGLVGLAVAVVDALGRRPAGWSPSCRMR